MALIADLDVAIIAHVRTPRHDGAVSDPIYRALTEKRQYTAQDADLVGGYWRMWGACRH